MWFYFIFELYELLFEEIQSNVNILETDLQQFCKRHNIFETIIYFEEILILALDKASR